MPVTDNHLSPFEVHILDAQAEALVEAEPAAVQQLGHEGELALEASDDAERFILRQHSRKAGRLLGPHASVDREVEGLLQNVAVQKQNGAQGLVLSGGGHVSDLAKCVSQAMMCGPAISFGWRLLWNSMKRVTQWTYDFSVL